MGARDGDRSAVKPVLWILGALIGVGFVVQMVGDVTGRFHYSISPEVIELTKWAMCAATGVTASGAIGAQIGKLRRAEQEARDAGTNADQP